MNDCNKYSTYQNYTAMTSIIFLGILLQRDYKVWKNNFLSLKEYFKHGKEKKTEREREIGGVCDGKDYPVLSQTSFDRYLFMGWVFLTFDTSPELIILKDAVKIETRDLQNLSRSWSQAGGWSQHMTLHQLC